MTDALAEYEGRGTIGRCITVALCADLVNATRKPRSLATCTDRAGYRTYGPEWSRRQIEADLRETGWVRTRRYGWLCTQCQQVLRESRT